MTNEPKLFNGKTRGQILKQWLVELRDPENKQTTGNLCISYNHNIFRCCLGVLCDVAGVPKRLSSDGLIKYGDAGVGWETELLPDALANFMGMSNDGDLMGDGRVSLVELNDDGKTFGQIAEVIEAGKVKGLEEVKQLIKEAGDEDHPGS